MVGIASRYFAGRIALAVAAATVIGVLTGMDDTGHVVMYATIVLGTAGGAFALLAALALTVGDSDSPDREHAHTFRPVPAYWPIMAAVWPAYDEYQAKTEREIPVVILERA